MDQMDVRFASLAIANAAELAIGVIEEVLGNEVSNTLDGSPVTKETLQTIVIMEIRNAIRTCKRGV